MTREEAITLIKKLRTFHNGTYAKAVDMSIDALKILGDDGIVNCCGCIHWESDGGAMMMCELWNTPMGDFDYCSYGERKGGDTE